MNKAILTLAAMAAAACAAGTASAAQFQPIGQRLSTLEQRIDQGVRNGAISRSEADSLHVGVARIRLFEAQYRRGGIDSNEQADLGRRFDNLARHVPSAGGNSSYRGNHDDRGFGNDRGNSGSYARRGRYQNSGRHQNNRSDYAKSDYRSSYR